MAKGEWDWQAAVAGGAALSQDVPWDLVRERACRNGSVPADTSFLAELSEAPWGLCKGRQGSCWGGHRI